VKKGPDFDNSKGWGIPNPWGAIKEGASAVKNAAGNMIPGSSDSKAQPKRVDAEPQTPEEPSKSGWGIPNPWGAIKNGAKEAAGAVGSVLPSGETVKGAAGSTWDKVKSGAGAVKSALPSGEAVKDAAGSTWDKVKSGAGAVKSALPTGSQVEDAAESTRDKVKSGAGAVKSALPSGETVKDAAESTWDKVKSGVNSILPSGEKPLPQCKFLIKK
jgi:hypothetical protein